MLYQQNIRQNTTTTKNQKMNINTVQSTIQCKHSLFLDKYFPSQNKFHKLFNRNTVKMSYCCMSNMKAIINSHNYEITNHATITKVRTYICIDKERCMLSQNCLINNIIYKAVSRSANPLYKENVYFNKAETEIKLQHLNQKMPFKFIKHKTDTNISNKVWQIKKSKKAPVITWEKVQNISSYNTNSKRCYIWMKKWNSLPTTEITYWTKNQNDIEMQTTKQVHVFQKWHKGTMSVVL